MSWYNNLWKKRIKITIDPTKVGGSNLTDFPVYVDLSNLPGIFFSNVKSDGTDIVITSSDGVTKLKRELVAIDTSAKTGQLHFKATSLSASINTIFYIYYGNSRAAEVNDTDVWRSEFSAVYHLKDGADNQHVNDSSSNTNTGTKTGAANPVQVTGKIGKGQTTATNKLINIGSGASIQFGTGEFAIFGWVKKTDTTKDNFAFSGNLQNSGNFDGFLFRGVATTGYLQAQIRTGGVAYSADSTLNIEDANYHRVVLIRRSTGIYIYEAGSQVGSQTDSHVQNSINNSTETVIGCARSGTANAGDGAGWPGDVDEFYYWKGTAPTDGWILADFNNQNAPASFYTVGLQESISSGMFAMFR